MAAYIRPSRTDRILSCAVGDIDFKCALKDLTPDDIHFCLGKERRKGAILALRREAKRRGIAIESKFVSVTCASCGWIGAPDRDWQATICPKCLEWIKIQ